MYESRHFPFGKGNEAGNLIDEYSNLSDPADAGEDSGITCTSDNRLATYNGQEVSYDADGNMTYGPLDEQMTSYSFDSRNRLTAAGNSIYTYDAESNRIGVNIDGEQYDDIINPHASLSQVLARTAADNSQTFYVYGLGLIGEENQNGCQVYHYDLRGSTVKLTDAAGSVTDSFQYDDYGKLTDHTGSSETSFLYNGQYGIMTDGNGLVYMRARYYNPDVHRFVSTDILEGDISDPLSLNRYIYCSNNPVNNLDPSGNFPVETIIDVASLGWSFTSFVNNPSLANFGYLLWDAAAVVVPYAPGSYVYKGISAGTKIISRSDGYVKTGVWAMNKFERGWKIESMLGGNMNYMKTIDKYVEIAQRRGQYVWLSEVTSIKSIDLTAASYQNTSRLRSTLKGYIKSLIDFEGTPYKGYTYTLDACGKKTLQLAIPPVEMTAGQAKVLQEIADYAAENHIEFSVKIVN